MTIQLSDQQASALQAKAAAEGLSVEDWIRKLAEPEPLTPKPLQTAADIILSCMSGVPPDIAAAMPKDGASQHDHYIYGWPKKET